MLTDSIKVGCFGKLPNFGDFVRYNFNRRSEKLFDEWLQEGIHFAKTHLNQQWEHAYEAAPAYQFFFTPENSEETLVGLLKPSRDRSDRKFPFIMSLPISSKEFNGSLTAFAPMIFNQFFCSAEEFIEQARNGWQLSDISEQMDDLNFSFGNAHDVTQAAFNRYLGKTTSEIFWARILGGFNEPAKYLLLKNLTDILIPLRDHDASRFTLGLRFPLGSNQPLVEDVCFWIHLSSRLLNRSEIYPNFFWTFPETGAPCYLYLFFGPPSPQNFEHIMIPDSESDTICKLDYDGSVENVKQAVPPKYQPLLQNRDVTLKNYLDAIND